MYCMYVCLVFVFTYSNWHQQNKNSDISDNRVGAQRNKCLLVAFIGGIQVINGQNIVFVATIASSLCALAGTYSNDVVLLCKLWTLWLGGSCQYQLFLFP